MDERQKGAAEPHYGWVMVALAPLYMALGIGSLLCVSVFLKPLEAEFGWPRGMTSLAYLAGTIALGLGGIVMGYLGDRLPARRLALVGALSLAVFSLGLARMDALWQFYLYYALIGALGAGTVFVPLMSLVGSWFTRHRGVAIGCTTAAFALLQGLMPWVLGALIAGAGWRTAYLTLGLFALIVLAPLSWLMRRPGEGADAGPAAAPTVPFALQPLVAVMFISAAVIFCCITMATPMMHVVALAQDKGFGTQEAAGVLAVLMVAGLFGRILIGRIADLIGGLRAYLLASATQTALVYGFPAIDALAGLYALAFVFGLGSSAVMTCIFICTQELTPQAHWGVCTGVVTFFGWSGMGLGGWQGGYFYDLTGTYTWSFAAAALAGIANLGIVGSLWLYLTRRQSGLQAQPAAL
jgi:MFS family permease